MPYYFDPTYYLVIIGAVICLIASAMVKRTYAKYSGQMNMRGITAEQAAEMILRREGINDVSIERISGNLTDRYDPRSKSLALSDTVYGSTSVAAIGVAAHECGHAIQHNRGYAPIVIRNAIVPVANIGSTLAWPMILLGLLFSFSGLITVGIILFSFAVIFQLVTLPVEFNASSRALRVLSASYILEGNELKGARKVLTAAAMTYVASAASAILSLLRLILISNRRRN